MQPIKVQTAPGKVESAIMHVIDMEASHADKRFTAMARQAPLHTFMFNTQGKLLVANDAAMEACLHSVAGLKVPDPKDITLESLFLLGAYEGDLLAVLLHSTASQHLCITALHSITASVHHCSASARQATAPIPLRPKLPSAVVAALPLALVCACL